MTITTVRNDHGIVEVIVDAPPVNALTVAGWFDLADQVTAAARTAGARSGPGGRPGAYSTILEIGSSRMSLAPAALRAELRASKLKVPLGLIYGPVPTI